MEGTWPLGWAVGALVVGALLTTYGGFRLAALGDVLADRSRIGEALFGAIFFGAVISLSGIVMTATAAAEGLPRLAFGNAVGGVAAQTLALGMADVAYRRANLEHAAASLPNLLSATLVVTLLTMLLLVRYTPDVVVLGVHPGSLVLVAAYMAGARIVRSASNEPLWTPTRTDETVEDRPGIDEEQGHSTGWLVARFIGFGALVAGSGWGVAQGAASIVARGGLEESFVGVAIMGIINALPEVVTSIAAVRRGALTLAVSGILGGNAFDVLNVVVGDVAYRDGSLHHAVGSDEAVVCLVAILMTAVILAGMLRRERHGLGNVGFEGVTMAVVYVGALALVVM